MLVGCSDGSTHPFLKAEGQTAQQTAPPTDYYGRASSGADQEIDYETLQGPGGSGPEQTGPSPANVRLSPSDNEQRTLATASDSAKGQKPGDRQRITGVAVLPVTGSTKERNRTVAMAMEEVLASAGWPVLRTPRPEALAIKGALAFGEARAGSQTIRVAWTVATYDGRSLGKLEQSNNIPAKLSDADWERTARAIATAAASGIFELVSKLQ